MTLNIDCYRIKLFRSKIDGEYRINYRFYIQVEDRVSKERDFFSMYMWIEIIMA